VLANDSDIDGPALQAVLVDSTTAGILTLNADGSFVYIHTPGAPATDSFTYRASDGTSQSDAVTVTLGSGSGSVVGRRIFYNGSYFDENDPDANDGDDFAIAPDKAALLPGGTATFANYTSYSKGINGVMVDIAGMAGVPTASDFAFKVGTSDVPTNWTALAMEPRVSVRHGAGDGGSDRVTLTWPDNAISKQWLQVTVLASAATGLSTPDVFYFGNAVGDSGNSARDARVSAYDEIVARNHHHGFTNPADLTTPYDYNRDRFVNAVDQIIARNNPTTVLSALELISVPALSPNGAAGIDAIGLGLARAARQEDFDSSQRPRSAEAPVEAAAGRQVFAQGGSASEQRDTTSSHAALTALAHNGDDDVDLDELIDRIAAAIHGRFA
jgi:VCBS repeat-containing protein